MVTTVLLEIGSAPDTPLAVSARAGDAVPPRSQLYLSVAPITYRAADVVMLSERPVLCDAWHGYLLTDTLFLHNEMRVDTPNEHNSASIQILREARTLVQKYH